MPPRVVVAANTDVGRKRTHNEDSYAVSEEKHLYIVADGMGGHASGEVASKMAIDIIDNFFEMTESDPEATWPYKMDRSRGYEENRLVTGVKLANLRIYESAQRDAQLRGMGTTLVAVRVVDDGVLIAHVGDSRVYRLREGRLSQLTEDHSLLNDYIKMKRLSQEEIENFPHKHVIVRALGMKESVRVDTILDPAVPGDIYVLCSDGLSGAVEDSEIQQIVRDAPDLSHSCSTLIQRANEYGGPDNITVVCAKVIGTN